MRPDLRVVVNSDVVCLYAFGANMYGCQPCPECGSKYRYSLAREPRVILCDDCGHKEQESEIRE